MKNTEWKQAAELLLAWFDANARILPWRDQPSPYRVWVSEIMLQQTRVEAVKPYYQRFMEELPDVESLAGCREERLLKLWEGLGYYNRVRNMQVAAQTVVEQYGGALPADYEKLRQLKGIGNYTAGAIASIAYGIPVAAVDGNVLRVFSRLTADGREMGKEAVKKAVEQKICEIIPQDRPGDFNQALMELGAVVCIPNGMAKCGDCPVSILCRARAENRVMEFPKKAEKKPRRSEDRTVLLIRDGDRIALNRRPSKGLLAGMYELPNVKGHLSEVEVLDYIRQLGYVAVRIGRLEDAKHIFSHIEWNMWGYEIRIAETEESGYLFAEVENAREKYAIPSAFQAYARYMQKKPKT